MTTPDRNLVIKFGGTSIGTPEAMAQAATVVGQTRAKWPRLVVILSAMAGVTNLLLESAHKARDGADDFRQAAVELRERHDQVITELVSEREQAVTVRQEVNALIADFSSLCQAILVLGETTPRALDAVASIGERLSVRVFSSALQAAGTPARYVEATRLIVTDDNYQAAHPDMAATRRQSHAVLEPMLNDGVVPVVTGFISASHEGVTTTLGRGGSDFTAGILGTALEAEEVWIFTDVDGVMTADPRMVPEASTIPELSFLEVAELAYFGAKVLHPKTIRPVVEAGIPLRIANTFAPDRPGTMVIEGRPTNADGQIKAVTAIRGQKMVTIEGRGMLGVPGVAARAFGAVAATGTSVILITQASSEQSICFTVPSDSVAQVITALERTFSEEIACRDIDRIWATGQTVIVTVVGAGLMYVPGIAGRIFTALGSAQVNVIAIAQGSSEVAISLVVSDPDTDRALKALHELIDIG